MKKARKEVLKRVCSIGKNYFNFNRVQSTEIFGRVNKRLAPEWDKEKDVEMVKYNCITMMKKRKESRRSKTM